MIQTYPNVDWKKQGISWPIHIYTLITSQWQRSSEESALMKVKQGNLVVRHIIVSFIRYTHTCLVPTPLKNWCFVTHTVSFLRGGMLRFHVSIFWRNKWSDIDFTRGNPGERNILTRSHPAIFFSQKKICPKFESPNGALYWFGADCAGEAPVKGKSKGTPSNAHPAQEIKGLFKVSYKGSWWSINHESSLGGIGMVPLDSHDIMAKSRCLGPWYLLGASLVRICYYILEEFSQKVSHGSILFFNFRSNVGKLWFCPKRGTFTAKMVWTCNWQWISFSINSYVCK